MLLTLQYILVTILTTGYIYMQSCMRILFIFTVQFLYYMRVYHKCFLTPACVSGRGLHAFFSLSMVDACRWRGGLCSKFGRGRDMGIVLHISLF